MNNKTGLTLVELLVILVILFILSQSLFITSSSGVMQANMTAVGTRGKDIHVAITTANAEREAMGLPPIWPSDAPSYTNHITETVECFDFDNSTDYFRYIFDEEHYGTDQWEPMVKEFDYSKLAGAGVKGCGARRILKPECNMWTIAKNVSTNTPDIIPFLITRNMDAEYLFSEIGAEHSHERIPLAKTWDTPFGNKGAVIIRKGGGMFKVRSKYATPLVIYNRQSFDANINSKYPLKYITPNKEVLPAGKVD